MTRKTTIRLTMTRERIEETHPSSSPFRVARRVIDTTGETVADSELPPSQPSVRVARPANVVQFPAARRVAR